MKSSAAPIELVSVNAATTTSAHTDGTITLTPAERIHLTFGHASAKAIRRLIKTGSIAGLPSKTPHGLDKIGGVNCKGCALGKTTRVRTAPVIPDAYQPTKPLERLDMDLIGPIKTGSKLATNSYILVIVEYYTRYTWVYLLPSKSDASEWIKYHITMLERTYPSHTITTLKSDGGGEFINNELYDYTMSKGINVVLSPPHTAHRNSIVERKNRQLLEMVRTLLISAGLPPIFWELATTYAVLIINRLVRRNGPGITPYEMISGIKPKLKHLKIFGSDCIIYLRKQERDNKMSATAMKCIYVGWYAAYQTHLVYSPETSNIFGTHHVYVINGKFTTPVNVKTKGYNNRNFDTLTAKDIVIDGAYSFKLLSDTIPAIRPTDKGEREADESPTVVTGTIHNDLINYGELGTAVLTNTKDKGTTINCDTIHTTDIPARGDTPESEQAPPAAIETNGNSQTNGSLIDSYSERSNVVVLPKGTVQHRSINRSPTGTTPLQGNNTSTGPVTRSQTRRVLPPRTTKQKQTYTVLTLVPKQIETGTIQVVTRIACNSFAVHKQVVHNTLKQLSTHATLSSISDIHAINNVDTTGTSSCTSTSAPASVKPPTTIKKVYEPRTIKEAQRLPEWESWKAAAAKEIDSQMNNGVWILVPASSVPTNQRPIRSRWIFKVKYNSDSTIDKFKARIVLKGFEQKYGIDYVNTYAPTLHLKSLKLMLAIVAILDLEMVQIDYTTAFLNAPIDENLYMEQPDGFQQLPPNGSTDIKDRLVCRLVKSLYGAKQAPHNWHRMVNTFMLSLGFKPLISDCCVYVKRSGTGKLFIISLYVDDKVICFHKGDIQEWNVLLATIQSKFKIELKGECTWILQMAITRNRDKKTLYLSQQKYVMEVVDRFSYLFDKDDNGKPKIKHRYNPTASKKVQLANDDGEVIQPSQADIKLYQEIIGSLIYAATHTRIDIAQATALLARYTANPQPHHLNAVLRVLEYLHTYSDMALVFRGDTSTNATGTTTGTNHGSSTTGHIKMTVHAYSDADWAGCLDTRRSTTGSIIMLNGNVIHWSSHKQSTVATSSTESEYMALAETAKELKWFNHWLGELLLIVPNEFDLVRPSTIKVDNTAAISLTNTGASHNRTKHIDVRYHFIKEQIANGIINMEWTPTTLQLADLLTKQLPKETFTKLVSQLMVQLSNIKE